jgi:hypothetical protein
VRRVVVLAALVLVGAALYYFRPWDPHLSAGEVERAVADDRPGVEVECNRSDTNDGSLQMNDVDYACVVDDGREKRRIWVGTDSDRITERDGWGG